MLHHDPQAIWSGDFLWWTVQDLHTVRPAVPVVVPPSSAGKRAIKKQFCRSRTARFAIQGKSALAELGCTTCSLQTVLLTFLHTRIAGQEAGLLQGGAQLGVELQQGAGQAVAEIGRASCRERVSSPV